MKKEIKLMGVDLGTSAVKCVVMDREGRLLSSSRRICPPSAVGNGRVEQRPQDWWETAKAAIADCLSQMEDRTITAISFSGHMSAPVLLGKDREPVCPSILIADTRSEMQAAYLRMHFAEPIRRNTGNTPVSAFTAPKLLWLKMHVPEAFAAAETFLFPKDYLRFCMTGVLATDVTDAGNSLLCDCRTHMWDTALCASLGLPEKLFPKILPSVAVCGAVTAACAAQTGLLEGTPVVCGAADMACSQLGAGAASPDVLSITLSTSVQLVAAVESFLPALYGKMTFHPGVCGMYAMASIFSGGLSVDWALRLLSGGNTPTQRDYDALKEQTALRYRAGEMGETLFLPFLTGSGSPLFDAAERGGFYSLTPATDKWTLLLAVLEGVAFDIRENSELLLQALPGTKELRLAGGGSRFPVWPQMLADVLSRPVGLLDVCDVSTLGAAMLAGAGIGCFDRPETCFDRMNCVVQRYTPQPEKSRTANSRYARYQALRVAIRNAVQSKNK